MTHLRLQKLLYYAQGLSLAYRGRTMFSDSIEAWRHGPVVPAVWTVFAKYQGDGIPSSEIVGSKLPADDADFTAYVWEGYRGYSAFALKEKTHQEPPWAEARRGLPENASSQREMTVDSMRRFFEDMCKRELKAQSGISMEQVNKSEEDAAAGRKTSWSEVKSRLAATVSN